MGRQEEKGGDLGIGIELPAAELSRGALELLAVHVGALGLDVPQIVVCDLLVQGAGFRVTGATRN
jgi:hypothetical protein